jgi:hypothetical protein
LLLLLLLPCCAQGYAFCEFADPRVIPQVINGLHMQVRQLIRQKVTTKVAT